MKYTNLPERLFSHVLRSRADLEEGKALVRSIITGDCAELSPAAKELSYHSQKVMESIAKLAEASKSCRHDVSSILSRYISIVESLKEAVIDSPTHTKWSLLCKHASHCETLLPQVRKGSIRKEHVSTVLSLIEEEDHVNGVTGMEWSEYGIPEDQLNKETNKRHEEFVKALEKDQKMKISRWEPCREGLFLYTDPENTDILLRAVSDYNSMVEKCLRKHGYLLLKQQYEQDIRFGTFPEPNCKWLFLYCPQHETGEE